MLHYEEGKTYTIQELYDEMPISIRQLALHLKINEVTLARIRDGRPTRRATANKLLQYFGDIYKGYFSIKNVSGINVQEYPGKRAESHVEPPKPTIKRNVTPEPIADAVRPVRKRKSSKPLSTKKPLPDGWEAWNSFLARHNLPPSSFDKRDFVEAGETYLLGNVTVNNPLSEVGQSMLLDAGRARYPGRYKQCDVSGCPCH
jgi:plasmid maintenance system antidote protein VapI